MALLTIGDQVPAYNRTAVIVDDLSNSPRRKVDDAVRVLDALQSEQLCTCNWKRGDPTISPGAFSSRSV
ncbi:alkyl hydroperoxide reductase [Rhodococcus oxybenzonivorans]|uniref:alkyl hydroperoxide reductase n=1 Tax=Rhodococcus TaxID=1827 RepID=UPI0037C7D8DD